MRSIGTSPVWMRVLGILAFMGTMALTCTNVLARAGGGGGYSGGGGGGFGGGGGGFGGGGRGGGGGGDLIRLIIAYPKICVPLIVVFIAFAIYSHRRGMRAYKGHIIRRGRAAMDRNQRAAAVAQLRQNDPDFDEHQFYHRLSTGFTRVQSAWSNQDLQAVRPFISDGIHERFSLQFDEQKAMGRRNQMEKVAVQSILLAQLETDGAFDIATVRIDASAADYFVSLADGRRVEGSTSVQSFAEYWSFLRRRGAKTKLDSDGLIEGNCPNCGAAIEMNQSAKCTHCGAILRSGQYDWVLVEITQECEWDDSAQRDVPGAAAMRQADPAFTLPALEDRVSVMFWRRAAADRLGKIDPLRKVAATGFCAVYAERLQHHRDNRGRRDYYGQCAVGSVDTLGLITGKGPMDRAVVEVRWSGHRFIIDPDGQIHHTDQGGVSHTLFILERRAGVKTNPDQGISSAHCPNCGAPASVDTSNACTFCGTVLNDGTRDWVLAKAMGRSDPEAAELLQMFNDTPAPGGISLSGIAAAASANGNGASSVPGGTTPLAWLIQTILADGTMTDKERRMLYLAADQQSVPRQMIDRMVDAARHNRMDIPRPRNASQARQWLTTMAVMAMADGQISSEEKSLLRSAAARQGFSSYDIRQIVKKGRAELYAQSRQYLRQERQRDRNGNN